MTDLALRGDTFEHIVRLADAGAITPTSLLLEDPDLPYPTYEALCAYVGQMNRSCSWWIGDLLVFGEIRYGETYAQAAAATGLAEQTLMNRVYVCKAIPPERRVAGVPFSVHALVAPLPPEDQTMWLQAAADNRWTRAQLETELRDRRQGASDGTEKPVPVGTDQPPTPPAREEPLELGALISAVRGVVKTAVPTGNGYHKVPSAQIQELEALL